MTKNENLKLCAQAGVLKALAHPTRLFILNQISQKRICMCELAAAIGADITTVSKHMLLLKNSGIVTVEKKRNQIFPRLKIGNIDKLLAIVDGIIRTRSREMLQLLH